MDERRMMELIRILERETDPVPSSVICDTLNITSRTLRNDVRESRDEFIRNGFEIQSVHAVGYYLEIRDEDQYYSYITKKLRENAENQMLVPVYPEERVDYLIRMFLSAEDYLKMDDICDELYISRSTLTNDLKDVRDKLAYFHLELESKPAYGLKVTGSEMHKRSCIAQYFFHTENYDEAFLSRMGTLEQQKQISEILYSVMRDEQFRLTDVGFQNLVIHLIITIARLRQAPKRTPYTYDESIRETREYEVAKTLCDRLGSVFSISFPEEEIYYVAMHLSGKKAIQYHGVTEEYQELLDEVLKEIREKYKMDFTFDMDLRTTLSLHIIPMMNRLKYGMVIQNPLLERIKEENVIPFEMGVLLAQKIRKKYGYDMAEAEIGFTALHFALAMERYKAKGAKKNVIIICASGLGSSQILLYKVRTQFKDYINSIYTTQLYDLPHVNQSAYDFILSTVPIPFETEIPAIHVQYFLDNTDVKNIHELLKNVIEEDSLDFVDQFFQKDEIYTNIKGKTREEVIHEMCERLKKHHDLPEQFESEVLRREQFASTEFGNALAMPHPMTPVSEESFVAVAVLPKAIRWGKERIKFVFLVSVSKNEEESFGLLQETLSALVFDKKALSALEKNPSKEELKRILRGIAESEKGNDLDTLFG